jgi:hypothetical protein
MGNIFAICYGFKEAVYVGAEESIAFPDMKLHLMTNNDEG